MKPKIILLMIILISSKLSGQDSINYSAIFPKSITIKYGIGNYSEKDEYISDQKYSGNIPYLSIGWARNHNKYLYHLDFEYRESDKIKNYNVSANITQLTINQGFLYPLKKRALFNRDLELWLGPSADFFFYFNKPNIAVSGFDYAQSFAALFSAGINVFGIYSLNSKFQVESSISTSILSLGFRMIDSEEDNQSPVNLLTLFSGINSSFDFGIRYDVFNNISIKAGYRFELCRISTNTWAPLIAISDNLIIGLTFNF